jgi:starch phosphorylase
MKIIYDINELFLDQIRSKHGEDVELLRRISLIEENGGRRVRMANLSVLASHKVNGVSKLPSQLLRETLFADFDRLFPGRFVNKTNGITPRRWLALANPALSRADRPPIGPEWRRSSTAERVAAARRRPGVRRRVPRREDREQAAPRRST